MGWPNAGGIIGGGTGGGAVGLSTNVAVLSAGKPLSGGIRLCREGLGSLEVGGSDEINVMLGGNPGVLATSASLAGNLVGSSGEGKGGDGS